MAENNTTLTQPQLKAIVALLETRTVEEAARRAGVAVRTLYRWLAEDEEFNARLRYTEDYLIGATVRRLLRLNEKAVRVIEDILDDKKVSDSVRLRAATVALEMTLKLRELRNVEERLAEIEQILSQRPREADATL